MRMFEVNRGSNTVYFMMAYANPPTYGYRLAYDRLKEMAGDSDHVVFLSPFQDRFLNPLPHDKAIHYNMHVFRDVRFYKKPNIRNSLEALQYLSDKYDTIYMVTEDENVRKFDRYHNYADDWDIFEFDILGLGDSKKDIPEERKNRIARQSVIDNDFNAFKKTIPSKDSKLISKLYLDLRKHMVGDTEMTDIDVTKPEHEQEDSIQESKSFKMKLEEASNNQIKNAVDQLIEFVIDKNKNISILDEYMTYDKAGNKVLALESINKIFRNIKLVLSDKTQNFTLGKDREDKNYVVFVNSNSKRLDKDLEKNRRVMESALKKIPLLETTAGSIASVNMPLGGEPIKRRNENLSYVKKIRDDKNEFNKFQKAMQTHIDKYGYIDSDAINEIKKILGMN